MSLALTRRRFMATAAAAGTIPFIGAPTARAQATGILTFGLSSYPPSFAALQSTGTAAGTVKLMIHRGLLGYDKAGQLRGELAEEWGVDDAGVWTFKLRDNAVWHDGRPVTAADIKWTIESGAAPDSAAAYKTPLQLIEKIEMPDDKTVKLTFSEPFATAETLFAHYNMPMLPEGSDDEGLVGAGPFKLADRERGVSIDLVASENYYRPGLPRLAGIKAVAYADENLRVAALEAGDVDLIEYVPWPAMGAIDDNPSLTLDVVEGPFMYLTFNGSRKPFDNKLVRQAIAHAIKREDVVDAAFFGRGAGLAHLPISDASPFYNPQYADAWAYDPEKAKALLAEAGHPDGFDCTLLSTAQYGMHTSTAEIAQAYLSMIGINVTLDLPDWATRVQKGNAGDFDFAVMGTSADSNDPDGIARLIDTSLPTSFVRSANLDLPDIPKLLAEGRATFDSEARKEVYEKLEGIAMDEVPLVGLCWRAQGYAFHDGVSGFKNLPGQLTFYSGLTLEETALS
ncbi:ABC transporter substrate-binding protein [Acuticoccus sediminis]|uniref:ABC transporter substrate-binding protein n=1 Tax=Acuticoccus sediminis TaxID=2184697 RepID=UPI001CFDF6FD|nr:ABC transporter substrate-binding protein [Acuticoccus sediminis]